MTRLLALSLLLAACASQPTTAPLPMAEPQSLALQATVISAQSTDIVERIDLATETRRVTEQAISDGQTATAFPVAMASTQLAQTATALPLQVTQAAIVDAATLGAVQTQQANAQSTQSAYAEIYTGMTATSEAKADYDARRAGEWLGNVGGGLVLFSLAVLFFVLVMVGSWVVYLFGVHTSNRVNAPLVVEGVAYLPPGSRYRPAATEPNRIAEPTSTQPDAQPLPPNAVEWQAFWLRCCDYAAEFGTLAFRGGFERVLRLEDWQVGVRDSFAHHRLANVVTYGNGTQTAQWVSGQNAATAREYFESVPDWAPPHPARPPLFVKTAGVKNTAKQGVGGVEVLQTS